MAKPRSLVPSEYYPSSPRSGNEGSLVFRMQNFILLGEGSEVFGYCYGGSKDIGENIATSNLTGTVTLDTTTTTIVGAGTAFTTELHLGQKLVAGTAPNHSMLVVAEITDDTHFRAARAPNASAAGQTATRLPRIFDVNSKRGASLVGNAVMFDKGTILGVGDGTLTLNGAALPGTSMTLTRSPKIALYNSATGNYTVFQLGMATPASLTAADQAGGTKNMQPATYSIRACAARLATNGYNNPSPKAEVTLTVAGHMIRGTFPAADTANGQDAWMIFVTLYTQTQAGINGPWFRFEQGNATVVVTIGPGAGQIPVGGGTYDIDYNDAEVSGNDVLTFNNLAPPKAEFIGVVGGVPAWISCQGPGSTSPGPFIAPAKVSNIEAAPPELYVSTTPLDTIVGTSPGAQGRLYLLCINSLQIAVATQAQDSRIPPLVARSFWKSGFIHTDQLLFLGATLVGATNNGLARSAGDGDESSVEYNFATAVNELVLPFNTGHMLLALDPSNTAACLFMSGYSLNASGFWTTRVLMYGFKEGKWIGDILLTSTTGDMLVSGVATVSDQLYFLAGGRQSGGGTTVRTYRWDDDTAGVSVPWYLAWQFTDNGSEDRPNHIGKYFGIVGKIGAGGTAGVYGAEPGESIPVAALEAGDHSTSKSGTITIPASSTVTEYDDIELNIDNLKQFTVRIDGTWNGTGSRDRIDEVCLESYPLGARR